MTYIEWRKAGKAYQAYHNEDGTYLGELVLHNWGRHIHWSWWQAKHIVMSPGCLDEVRQKMKKLFPLRNSKKIR